MKFIKRLFIFTFICIILGVGTIFGFYLYLNPELPDVVALKDVQLQTPMQVFSGDDKLIAQFGEKRRIPLKLKDMPPELVDAFIATEDSRFYEHYGFDPVGILRASVAVITSGSAKQGASTITQQLARNFFLSNEKKIMRKIKEVFIAVHIEKLLSKKEILELYLNKIYLGYRSYGVGAAAQVYFGKNVQDLTLSEMAVIAGLPKAPSTMNPIYSLERSTSRRNVVLSRMLEEHYITKNQYEEAKSEPIVAYYHGAEIQLNAPYVAELARAWAVEHYGEDAYTSGLNIYTTVDSKLQKAAHTAAISNLYNYDERHGYRGAKSTLWKDNEPALSVEQVKTHLEKQDDYGDLLPAVVMDVQEKSASVYVKQTGLVVMPWSQMAWARKFISDNRQGVSPSSAKQILKAGEQIWVRQVMTVEDDEQKTEWHLSQIPGANTAFVAMDPDNGAIQALIGGFNFAHSKFNRATQSIRQVGSGIKPFIYSAGIDSGMTLATLINDAPINQWDQSLGTAWRPKNSPPRYGGPTRVRIGLAQSKNVMAVRVLREVGLERTREYLTRFGFDLDNLPKSETLALGAGSLTPVKLAQGYSVFVNGGYYIKPYYVKRVEDPYHNILYQAEPVQVCTQDCNTNANDADETPSNVKYAPQVITSQNAFLVRQMLHSNIWGGGDWRNGTGWNGTGWRAQALKRRDIGGKTGTTNDAKDAWYNGFGPGIVATAWIGFDDNSRILGRTTMNQNIGHEMVSGAEAGAKTAQPAWIDFMKVALKDKPEQEEPIPPQIIQVRIDRSTGLLTNKTDGTSMFEYFIDGTQPQEYVQDSISTSTTGEELF